MAIYRIIAGVVYAEPEALRQAIGGSAGSTLGSLDARLAPRAKALLKEELLWITWPANRRAISVSSSSRAARALASAPVGCLYSIGGAGGECPSREKPLGTDACVQSTGPQQSRQRSTAGERKTAASQSPIEFWHPTRGRGKKKKEEDGR
jgi:hypothetical protein